MVIFDHLIWSIQFQSAFKFDSVSDFTSLNGIPFKNGIDSTCTLETTAFAKLVVKMCLVVP